MKFNGFNAASAWIARNARPLEFARWQYHFAGGSADAVLSALAVYQNEDGGFAYALEPDSWNPKSSPIQTWAATEILRETDTVDPSHPVIKGILKYLSSGADFVRGKWLNTVQSNNKYPHAPWWEYNRENNENSFNPTAALAGFALRFAEKDSPLYGIASAVAQNAADFFLNVETHTDDMHLLSCYVRLWEYCREGGVELFDLDVLESELKKRVTASITSDISEWTTMYVCRPSQFLQSRMSIFYADNSRIADFECDFIIKTQKSDGTWNVPFSWAKYPEEWAVSKNWWRAWGIIENMLYLKGFDRL